LPPEKKKPKEERKTVCQKAPVIGGGRKGSCCGQKDAPDGERELEREEVSFLPKTGKGSFKTNENVALAREKGGPAVRSRGGGCSILLKNLLSSDPRAGETRRGGRSAPKCGRETSSAEYRSKGSTWGGWEEWGGGTSETEGERARQPHV